MGLYDMMTDGLEWMLDWYSPTYYSSSPERNPKGPPTGTDKVLRSSRNSSGEALALAGGRTIDRYHRQPDPPKINGFTREPDPDANMTYDTAARCVVNLATPIPNAR
jgi:hypothetical protein